VQTLITAVAQVGVDINAMAANTWRQAPLQFVPGLGPRKAKALLAAIAANDNHIKTRIELLIQVSSFNLHDQLILSYIAARVSCCAMAC